MTTSAQDTAIAGVQSAFGTTPTKTDSSGQDSFLTTLQNKLMGMSSLVSSDPTSLETAISSSKQATEQGAALLESQGNRAIAAQKDQFAAERGSMEGGTGFAFNSAALKNLNDSTDKSLKDMEQRKQELILQNNIAGANKIADLQVKAEEFRQNARQQAFSNILNMGQFALQGQAQANAVSQFKESLNLQKATLAYQETSDISKIATQFGLTVNPGETLASITNRAKPFASAEQKARLATIVGKSTNDNTEINVSGTLQEAITGTGSFKDWGPQSPAMAALSAANYMKSIGITPTAKDINRFTEQATKLQTDYNTTLEKSKAEVVGNSFWGNFSNFFGGAATQRAQTDVSSATKQYKSLQPRTQGTYETPSFFNLFNQ